MFFQKEKQIVKKTFFDRKNVFWSRKFFLTEKEKFGRKKVLIEKTNLLGKTIQNKV